MKKSTKIIIAVSIILVIAILATIAIFAFVNQEKKAITFEEFKTNMEEKGFIISDVTSEFTEYGYIETVCIAASQDYSYQIEYYKLLNEEYAVKFYNKNKSIFENEKTGASVETEKNGKNYLKYALETNGKYSALSKIDNTVMYVNADATFKNDIKSILKELGY